MRLSGLIELFFMRVQVNCLHVQRQSLFHLPFKTLLCHSHFTEKQKQRRSHFSPQAKEGCWHHCSWLFFGFFPIRLQSPLGQGLNHIITHKSLLLSLTLQIIFCNGMLLFQFWTTYYFESLMKAVDRPPRKMHICTHRTWHLLSVASWPSIHKPPEGP